MPSTYRDRVRELPSILDIDTELFKPIKTFFGWHAAQAGDHPQPDAPTSAVVQRAQPKRGRPPRWLVEQGHIARIAS
jgi:hypothetical protein